VKTKLKRQLGIHLNSSKKDANNSLKLMNDSLTIGLLGFFCMKIALIVWNIIAPIRFMNCSKCSSNQHHFQPLCSKVVISGVVVTEKAESFNV